MKRTAFPLSLSILLIFLMACRPYLIWAAQPHTAKSAQDRFPGYYTEARRTIYARDAGVYWVKNGEVVAKLPRSVEAAATPTGSRRMLPTEKLRCRRGAENRGPFPFAQIKRGAGGSSPAPSDCQGTSFKTRSKALYKIWSV